ncbi:MAG: hypothetical protein LH603_00675 [Pseudonocardia sp.]|nr:hypothetical protein [Pseudonocardia sp.]
MATLRYDVVDVFTDRPYAGNPLAVVHGGTDLSTCCRCRSTRTARRWRVALPRSDRPWTRWRWPHASG